MRLFVFIVTLLLFLTQVTLSQAQIENKTTRSGEWARYEVYYNWGFIWMNAAEVIFSTTDFQYNDANVFRLRCVGRTYDSYDWFFCVRDTFESIVDPISLRPYKFKQRNYEGKRRTINDYTYNISDTTISMKGEIWEDDDERTAKYNLQRKSSPNAVDVLTMVYKARNIDYSRYAVGEEIPITMIINAESYDLYIRYLGKERIKTKEGRIFDCIKINPLLVDGTIFSGGEDMTVWVTNDKSRVPVVIEAKVIIGSVKAMFVSGKGFQDNLSAEIKRKE